MNEQIPSWLTNLALDIYKVIKQYDAMPRFREMVDIWAKTQEAEIKKHIEWDKQRDLHFEQKVLGDHRLQDEQAGPPTDGWQFELYVQHIYIETESVWQHKSINGWVPPELSFSAEPKITHLLPLSREHELTLSEKYTVLAAIYDYGRKGTAKLPPWNWPKNWDEPEAVSNATKCIFFESLRDITKNITPNDEGWLREILDDLEKDVCDCKGVKLSQLKENTQTDTSETRVDKLVRKAKDHYLISSLILFCIVIIGLGSVFGGIDQILSFWDRITHEQPDLQKPSQDVMDTRILTATAAVEITIASDEKGKTNHIASGTYLAFAKGQKALLVMSSTESTSEQTGRNSVRYTSNISIEPTSRALNQPLSLLKQTEYIQICLQSIPAKSHILSGKALCVFNGNIPMEIQIPPQEMSSNVITIQDFDVGFSKIR